MARVVLRFSMSLDGYVAGPRVSDAHPMGICGERLHDWMFPGNRDGTTSDSKIKMDETDTSVLSSASSRIAAVVLGRRTFDIGHNLWQDTPYPVPSFVVTHRAHAPMPMKSAPFTFVTDGVVSAISQAKAVAGEGDVVVMGADIANQVLGAGLADAVHLQLVPILLCGGTRLFEDIGSAQIKLLRTRVMPSGTVTHMDFDVVA